MKRIIIMAMLAIGCVLTGGALEISRCIEDAAYQVARKLNADARVTGAVKTIALAKLFVNEGQKNLDGGTDEAVVFETALAAVPGKLNFVLHASNEAEWKLLDEVFRQARDMDSWDPKTCPALKKLKLCEAVLVGHIIGAIKEKNALSVRLAMRLVKVATGEELWGAIIEGRYSDAGPDNEQVSLNWRRALEACARDAVAKLPASLDGYGVLLLPLEGKSGKAMGQVFLNALTAAGKQESISVYDLPSGNAQDRMLARYLGERAAGGAFDDEALKRSMGRLVTAKKLPAKLAVMSGMVSVVNESPKYALTDAGLPVDFLGNAQAKDAEARKSYEMITDIKFRDVNDSFRLIAAIGANGVYEPPAPARSKFDKTEAFLDRLFSFSEKSSVARMVKIVLAGLVVLIMMTVIRKIIGGASRPR